MKYSVFTFVISAGLCSLIYAACSDANTVAPANSAASINSAQVRPDEQIQLEGLNPQAQNIEQASLKADKIIQPSKVLTPVLTGTLTDKSAEAVRTEKAALVKPNPSEAMPSEVKTGQNTAGKNKAKPGFLEQPTHIDRQAQAPNIKLAQLSSTTEAVASQKELQTLSQSTESLSQVTEQDSNPITNIVTPETSLKPSELKDDLAQTAPEPKPVREPVKHIIEIKRFKFSTPKLEVNIGDEVTWVNLDIVPHTATANDKSWDSGELKKDERYTMIITDETSLAYFCLYHPHMKAEFVIDDKT